MIQGSHSIALIHINVLERKFRIGRSCNKASSFPNQLRDSSSSAILREQGVNGHVEMAAAFDRAGFNSYDVVMADLLNGETNLDRFNGIVMCGGFSFGDVLGAGRDGGYDSLSEQIKDAFESYFSDTSKFALGVCNGCQVMAEIEVNYSRYFRLAAICPKSV